MKQHVTASSPLRRLIFADLKTRKGSILLALIGLLGVIGLEILAPWPLKIVIDHILLAKPLPDSLSWFAALLTPGTMMALVVCSSAIALNALLAGGFSYLQAYTSAKIGHQLVYVIRQEVFSHLQQLSLSFHMRTRSGELLTKVASDTNLIREVFADWAIAFAQHVLTVLGMVTVMFLMNAKLTLVVMTTLPLLFAVLYYLNREIKMSARAQRKHEGKLVSRLNEVLSSMALVQAFGREEFEQERFALESANNLEAGVKNARVAAAVSKATGFVTALGTAGTVLVGTQIALEGHLSPGDLLIFVTYVRGLYKPIKDIGKLWAKFSRAQASAERIDEILVIEPDILDDPQAVAAHNLSGAITFDDVSFSYPQGKPVLSHVRCFIRPGERVAIIGPSGAGKSTLVSLMLRLYDPQAGTVRLDRRPVSSYTRDSLRREIGIVLQDTVLIGASIKENIAYGKPNACDHEIEWAARAAHAHEFIMELPDGYDSVIGERGCTLSGGQRQRICLARAIIKQPSILILDEPTSAVDPESARLIEAALATIHKGKTMLVIGHQFSSLANFDRIFAIENGRLMELNADDEMSMARVVMPAVGVRAQASM
jgi:ATP-binding cassette, subfamily B, bacterial